jgi:hypothetical protein
MRHRCVVAFAGHMIDQPTRPSPRFPAWADAAVQAAVREAIARLSPTVAVSSAACGGDIIFAEEILRRKIPLYVVLPFKDRESFIQQSVAYAGEQWVSRFRNVCIEAKDVYFVKPGPYEDDRDFLDNQHAIIFFAQGFAAAVGMKLICLILYDDTQPEDGIGGTVSFFKLLNGLNIEFDAINMTVIRTDLQSEQEEQSKEE